MRWPEQREDGHALLGASVGTLLAVVLVAVAVQVGALLVARSRAATAADHGALAAATALADPSVAVDAVTSARRVVAAMDGRLVRCDCGQVPVRVVVAVDVPSALVQLPGAITVVQATGRASLVPAPGATSVGRWGRP